MRVAFKLTFLVAVTHYLSLITLYMFSCIYVQDFFVCSDIHCLLLRGNQEDRRRLAEWILNDDVVGTLDFHAFQVRLPFFHVPV